VLVASVDSVAGRQKMMEDFHNQVQLIFQQWEADVEKTRENEERLQVIMTQTSSSVSAILILYIVTVGFAVTPVYTDNYLFFFIVFEAPVINSGTGVLLLKNRDSFLN